MKMVADGTALCVPGNHDVKLMRALQGKNVKIAHGLEKSLAQLETISPEEKTAIIKFIEGLVSHYVLDDGKLVVVHAGIKETMQGRGSKEIREFALYGETTGETDEFGLPVRYNWAAEYKGQALVVYGHTPTLEPQFLNRTICIDTGCVFGGSLTALRYPEQELISVQALEEYATAVHPLQAAQLSLQHTHDEMLSIDNLLGKRIIETRLKGRITIREENTIAALEVMSRFAVNPKWLVYLPPTMSPVETSPHPEYLERPEEAFKYYTNQGVQHLILEEKHMGSRAIIVICRDQEAAQERFGVLNQAGMIYTRTGRRFFSNESTELALLEVLRHAMTQSDFWTKHQTTWAILDCELMPWSAKAQELLRQQYAPVGAAAQASLSQAVQLLQQAGSPTLLETYQKRLQTIAAYQKAYAQYYWEINNLQDYKIAPFHLLATENAVHTKQNHVWHLEQIAQICEADTSQILLKTAYRAVDLSQEQQKLEAIQWWENLINNGGEGIVCKPLEFISHGKHGLIQPAMKIRGREYLRIIYGAEYTLPQHLERLKARGLSAKRSLALREFALGIESLERFVKREALQRTHEAVFAVLALESEPVDPRL
jgi:protein phosphatase